MSDGHTEQLREYRAAFEKLPWVQREIFRLHAVEDYSCAEIALLLRTNVQTVERQMAKAIWKIAKQMDGYRVFSGDVEIGAGCMRRSEASGPEYVSLSLAAPEFGPRRLYVNLGHASSADEDTFALIWNPAG